MDAHKTRNVRCRCTTSCSDDNCRCCEHGASRHPKGRCTTCANPLAGLATLFGEGGIRANKCFNTMLKGLCEPGSPPINFENATFVHNLRCALLGLHDDAEPDAMPKDDVFDTMMDEQLGKWVLKWKDRKLTSEERDELTEELFRMGLGFEDRPCHRGWFYSFCQSKWVQSGSGDMRFFHCIGCGECKEWRNWHCTVCNFCTFGFTQKCAGCGRVSKSYGPGPLPYCPH
jgi:hypothetical protein